MTCDHTVTRGREGVEGYWCEACGVQVMAVSARYDDKGHLHHRPRGPDGKLI
ncbi:hypothetical protein SAMN05444123_11278 [Rhodopseudomonas pseudopalustris]|uniref:Uncharacterized protein n=1 Tax=Rhodopseudomonas pseudopalustris TaxID=1513892 RepID=A0A1H8WGR5_9BRAD|nr:hypothetical protein SAMN05444123_11278 [Rhodopseudomonas pseudopalustris]